MRGIFLAMRNRWWLAALIALGLLLRCDLLGRPFVEYFANRQVQNAITIRLLQEGRFTLATLPTHFTDTFGVAEFPLLQVIVLGAYRLLEVVGVAKLPAPGDADEALRYYLHIAVLGRLWSLLMSAATMYLLQRLLREAWSGLAALFAVFWYALLPYNRFFDQLYLTEPTIMALSCFGLYHLWRWSVVQKPGGWWSYFFSCLACALILLLKINYVMIGIPIGYLFYQRYGWRSFFRWPVWLFAIAVLLPAAYFYLLRGSWVVGGMDSVPWRNTVATFTDWSFASCMLRSFWQRHAWTIWTPAGTALCGLGFLTALQRQDPLARRLWGLLAAWVLAWVYYWFMNGEGSGHFYYQSPSVPLAAAFMGFATAWLIERSPALLHRTLIAVIAALFLLFDGVVQQGNPDNIRSLRSPWDQPPMVAGLAADRQLPRDAKVVAGCVGPLAYPMFYYLHRDGWFLSFNDSRVDYETPQEEAPQQLERYRERGAEFYVAAFLTNREAYGGRDFGRLEFEGLPIGRYLLDRYPVLQEEQTYIIFDLRAPRQPLV